MATALADIFYRYVVCRFGLPKDIVSDRSSLNTSKFWRALVAILAVTPLISTAYHPQTDGQTKRVNQILSTYLRHFVNVRQNDWARLLCHAEFVYNNSTHSATKMSPFFTHQGYHPLNSITLPVPPTAQVPSVLDHFEELTNLCAELVANLQQAQEWYSEFYNCKVLPAPEFKVGQLVFLQCKNIKTTCPMSKLDYK